MQRAGERFHEELGIRVLGDLAAGDGAVQDGLDGFFVLTAHLVGDGVELGIRALDHADAKQALTAGRRSERQELSPDRQQVSAKGAGVLHLHRLGDRLEGRAHQIFLGGPAAIDGGLGDARLHRDVFDAEGAVADEGEVLERRAEDRLDTRGADARRCARIGSLRDALGLRGHEGTC